MTDKIDQIRALLTELEKQLGDSDDQNFMQNFNALEVPGIVSAIVDYLQPDLLPYEAAIYWHLFRHSILANGQQYVRVSVRGLTENVITSASGQSETLSYNAVRKTLQCLEQKSAILKSGDTNREGTLYKIFLPEEISSCQERMKAKEIEKTKDIDIKNELDYYNVSENRLKIFERDSYRCYYCGKQLTRFTATLDHVEPISRGGDNSYDNLITSCLHCNSQRSNRPVMDFITKKRNS